ncbi:hypothetical protein DFR58_101268 [Anaerobacterium chartisolvens]|uniref:RES domain-containing protein n=1 Tax=Anaerobacterium chartisolvens TaxID=1297424 RepID=A0A369BKC5_9FIRM|nr:hypothetical protein [Anaerobacterium chartisolvens]RCX21058.1 hypothetical protein DFR58_101268 [Anaerobacterium chartisolvens]
MGLKEADIKADIEEFKNALFTKKVRYNDLEGILKYRFIKVLDQSLSRYGTIFEEDLRNISNIYRGRRLKPEDSCFTSPEDFVPDWNNRMNPPGFLYLAFTPSLKRSGVIYNAQRACIEELKPLAGERFSVASFRPVKGGEKRLINLCRYDGFSYEDMLKECGGDERLKNLKNVDSLIGFQKRYMGFLSETIFKPVDDNDKKQRDREYSLTHAMSYYFQQKGYAGVIYKCTRMNDDSVRNLALFDMDDVECCCEYSHFKCCQRDGSIDIILAV